MTITDMIFKYVFIWGGAIAFLLSSFIAILNAYAKHKKIPMYYVKYETQLLIAGVWLGWFSWQFGLTIG